MTEQENEALALWALIMGALREADDFFRQLDGSAIRLEEDWPEEDFKRAQEAVERVLYPRNPPSAAQGNVDPDPGKPEGEAP